MISRSLFGANKEVAARGPKSCFKRRSRVFAENASFSRVGELEHSGAEAEGQGMLVVDLEAVDVLHVGAMVPKVVIEDCAG